jgi:hypothetical protein
MSSVLSGVKAVEDYMGADVETAGLWDPFGFSKNCDGQPCHVEPGSNQFILSSLGLFCFN